MLVSSRKESSGSAWVLFFVHVLIQLPPAAVLLLSILLYPFSGRAEISKSAWQQLFQISDTSVFMCVRVFCSFFVGVKRRSAQTLCSNAAVVMSNNVLMFAYPAFSCRAQIFAGASAGSDKRGSEGPATFPSFRSVMTTTSEVTDAVGTEMKLRVAKTQVSISCFVSPGGGWSGLFRRLWSSRV